MDNFEKEVIAKIAVLETKMDTVVTQLENMSNYKTSRTVIDYAKIGSILTGISIVVSYIVSIITKVAP